MCIRDRRNFNSQVDLIPLCWCRILRSKKMTHFPALWKCQDMAWANPGIERRLQSWLWRSLSCRRKAQLPSFTAIHHSHHASPCRTWFRSKTINYHNSVIFTTRMKTTTFLFSLLLFWIVEFFSRNWHFLRWKSKSFSKISTFLLENKILKSYRY